MVCVSIGCVSVDECLKILKNVEFAEIRIDRMGIGIEEVRKIFSSHTNLIATCRDPSIPHEKRKELLIEALESGASYVDVDIFTPTQSLLRIQKKAKEKGSKVIVSYHDFEKTGSFSELKGILEMCLSFGDYGKISCMVRKDEDNLNLLRLLKVPEFKNRTIVTGMGEKGKLTRVLSLLLGSPFTFASYEEGKETAEGQIERTVIKGIMELFFEK
ncbi:MAG: type I 3-dehydroquinate dehydratase [Desulfobacterota bacterium]|nr:type I 3-dehydroquinate dehydratase [Thermodesulfobacteriota bacterium]MDW8002718.1 type I 3-dehydroquinate dehydratase [Deltaproteobacteria bacterium]